MKKIGKHYRNTKTAKIERKTNNNQGQHPGFFGGVHIRRVTQGNGQNSVIFTSELK